MVFDLLDYGDWVDNDLENEISAESFDIEVDESSENYKWGYNVKKLDPMFQMAAAGRLSIKMPEKRKQKET